MHEHARGLPFPVLDMQLVLLAYGLGYSLIKAKGNRDAHGRGGKTAGAFSGDALPEEVVDRVWQNATWVPVPHFLTRGIGEDPRMHDDWIDFYLKLSPRAMLR